jgi:tetratricopeptide (TPR) repeat protein
LARGRLLWTPANHFPHEKAIQEYNRALAIDPNLDEARNQLALVYCHIGAFDEALEQSQKAMSTNPGNNLAQFRTGQTLNFQGRYDDALRVLNGLSPDVNPALVGQQTAWALFNLGRTEEASVKLEQLLKDYPNDEGGLFTSIQAVIAASAGRNNQAEELIQLAISKGKGFGHFHHTAYHIACAFALMNKRGDAVKWLETAADGGFPCYPLFERDDNLKNLREDSGFATFLAGQRQQWESYKSAL